MMKYLKYLAFLSLVTLTLTLAGCGDDEDNGPGTAKIAFTVTGLTGLDAAITVSGPAGFSQTVTSTTTLSDLALGDYTVTIDNVGSNGQLFAVNSDDSEQTFTLVADATETIAVAYQPAGDVIGIVGRWFSAGADVAPLLVTLFDTDSIYAEFRADMTYTVQQFDGSGASLTLSGVYTQTASGTGSIYEIVVDQSSPAALTSEGIFEITSDTPDAMSYEIVQTSPDIGAIPPTATDGFGSSSGGILGTTNVQTYRRLVE
ncbi:MAG: hypothetical protein AAFX87_14855 [Bacteroidota bacterium]